MEENPIKFNNNSYGAIYEDKQLLDQHHDEEQQQHFNHSKLRLLNDAEEQQQQQQIFIEKISTVNSQDGDKLVDAADEGGKKKKEGAKTRDLIAFFICGLLNNYSYVIMLSAAGTC